MNLSYRLPERNEEILALAEKIVNVLISSGMTYQQGSDALSAAQEMLATKTVPVKRIPMQEDEATRPVTAGELAQAMCDRLAAKE